MLFTIRCLPNSLILLGINENAPWKSFRICCRNLFLARPLETGHMLVRTNVIPVLILATCLVGCDLFRGKEVKVAKEPVIAAPGPEDPDAPKEFTTTESGLKYRILRKSDGEKPKHNSMVTVHFRGWLDNGDLFDTSYGTNGTPHQYAMNLVIPGWKEGLLLLGEGGMIELEIPSGLGYGQIGQPPMVPGNATLHFLIELKKVGGPAPEPESHEGHDHPHTPEMKESGKPAVSPGPVDADAPEAFTTTASGLKYRIRRKSDGVKPTPASRVFVHYKGWVEDGTVFDQSYTRGQVIDFPLGSVIAGWTEGLQLVGKGGMIELEIPSKLGYPQGRPPHIKPGATLYFLIELVDVVN